MNDRVLRPFLTINQPPPNSARFVSCCQTIEEAIKPYAVINLECKLNNIDTSLLPNLSFYVVVSLTHDYEPFNSHPFSLKCLDHKVRIKSEILRQNNPNLVNCYFFELDNTTMNCKIHDLYIESVPAEKIVEFHEKEAVKFESKNLFRLLSSENSPVDWQNSFEQIERNISEKSFHFYGKNYNSARLKLQVIIHEGLKFDSYLTEPLFTDIIENSKNKKPSTGSQSATSNSANTSSYLNSENNSLKILRSSRLNGSFEGNDELYLLCSQFDPNDIQVEFFQLKHETEISWRVFVQIDKTEIHYNNALVVRTPKYDGHLLNSSTDTNKEQITKSNSSSGLTETNKDQMSKSNSSTSLAAQKTTIKLLNDKQTSTKSKSRVKVYFRLFKPSTKEYSDKWIFYYCPEDISAFEFRSLFENYFHMESFARRYREKYFPNFSSEIDLKKKVNKRKKKQIKDATASKSTISKINESTTMDNDDKALYDMFDSNKVSPYLIQDDEEIYGSDIELDPELETPSNFEDASKVKKMRPDPSQMNTNSNDSDCSKSPIANLINKTKTLRIDTETQTESTGPRTLESRFEFPRNTDKAYDQQLKTNLENCIAKMNALADRTGKSLIKFSKTRSLHELLKTQRFLLNAQDEDGNTPMHLAILYGNFDLLEIIVDVSLTIPYQNLINLKNYKQLTPLLIAAHLGEIEVCEFLLEANADLTLTDLYGCNCIHIACRNKNVNLLKLLLKYVEKGNYYSILNSINHDGYAPIHLAVMSQSTDLVRELLYMKNLKVNIQDKRAGYSALHHAVGTRNLLPVTNLLVNNESIEIDIKAYNGCTPLHVAIANKNYLITSQLLSHGANLNLTSDMHVHCDIEMFQAAAKRNNLLRRCIEKVLKDNLSNVTNSRSTNQLETSTDTAKKETSQTSSREILDSINHVKLSEEIKQMFDAESEKEKIDDLNDPKVRAVVFQHNYDCWHYAQNDQWVSNV